MAAFLDVCIIVGVYCSGQTYNETFTGDQGKNVNLPGRSVTLHPFPPQSPDIHAKTDNSDNRKIIEKEGASKEKDGASKEKKGASKVI